MPATNPQRPRWSLSLDVHRALEAVLGLALVVLSLFLGFELVVIVPACLVGLALTTLGFSATREGRTMEPLAHRAFDLILVVVLVLAAVLAALVADTLDGAALLAAAAALLFALCAFTVYAGPVTATDGPVAATGDDERQGSYTG